MLYPKKMRESVTFKKRVAYIIHYLKNRKQKTTTARQWFHCKFVTFYKAKIMWNNSALLSFFSLFAVVVYRDFLCAAINFAHSSQHCCHLLCIVCTIRLSPPPALWCNSLKLCVCVDFISTMATFTL